ncbi:MAG: hypothetical protein ACI93R_000426 [Flavobacteriales bacterium]|jgi:hypothetical protein
MFGAGRSGSPRKPLKRKTTRRDSDSNGDIELLPLLRGGDRESASDDFNDDVLLPNDVVGRLSGDERGSDSNSDSRRNVDTDQDKIRTDLGLPTASEERDADILNVERIAEIERQLAEILQARADEREPITEEAWRQSVRLEDELDDRKYAAQLAKDRRQLTRIDDALASARLGDSILQLLSSTREQFLQLMLAQAHLHQFVLNRRVLRDLDDAPEVSDEGQYEEVKTANGQLILKRKGLGQAVLREPDFEFPRAASSSLSRRGTPISGQALIRLSDRLRSGLLPAISLDSTVQPVSGDDRVRTVVSTNIVRPGDDPQRLASFLANNAAGGAIPIAIEQFGDQGVDIDVLSRRAMNSAVFVIDSKRLHQSAREGIESLKGGGEFQVGGVPADAIVAIIIPGEGSESDEEINGRRLLKVNSIQSDVEFNYGRTREIVTIDHPDYETGFWQVLEANPDKTLLFHTTRLGGKNPIDASSSASKGKEAERPSFLSEIL